MRLDTSHPVPTPPSGPLPMRLALTNVPTAILLGAVIIAGGIVGAQFVPRYQVSPAAVGSAFYRVNASTGTVEVCRFEHDPLRPYGPQSVGCHPEI